MARFRNRIVYFYGEVDLRVVYAPLGTRLTDFERYLAAVEGYLGRRV